MRRIEYWVIQHREKGYFVGIFAEGPRFSLSVPDNHHTVQKFDSVDKADSLAKANKFKGVWKYKHVIRGDNDE